MMKKIINYINICHIVLNKIIYIYICIYNIHIRVWYYFIMWEG